MFFFYPALPISASPTLRCRYVIFGVSGGLTVGEGREKTIRCDDNRHSPSATTGAEYVALLSECIPLGTVRPLYRTGVSLLSRERFFMYLINKYISLSDICLTVYH